MEQSHRDGFKGNLGPPAGPPTSSQISPINMKQPLGPPNFTNGTQPLRPPFMSGPHIRNGSANGSSSPSLPTLPNGQTAIRPSIMPPASEGNSFRGLGPPTHTPISAGSIRPSGPLGPPNTSSGALIFQNSLISSNIKNVPVSQKPGLPSSSLSTPAPTATPSIYGTPSIASSATGLGGISMSGRPQNTLITNQFAPPSILDNPSPPATISGLPPPPSLTVPPAPPSLTGPHAPPLSGPRAPPPRNGPPAPPSISGPPALSSLSGPPAPPLISGPRPPTSISRPPAPPTIPGPRAPPLTTGPPAPATISGPNPPPLITGPPAPPSSSCLPTTPTIPGSTAPPTIPRPLAPNESNMQGSVTLTGPPLPSSVSAPQTRQFNPGPPFLQPAATSGPPSFNPPPSSQYTASHPVRPRYPSYPTNASSATQKITNGVQQPHVSGIPPLAPSINGMAPTFPPGNGMPPPLPGGQPQVMPGMPPPPPVNGNNFQNNFGDVNNVSNALGNLAVTQQGFRKLWGQETLDLLQNRHILPPSKINPPEIRLQTENWNSINCDKDIFRCTLNRIPETDALLKKSRLPLGVLIHPYKDLSHLPVIQCSTIVRCRSCRTYINPFVHFVDQRRWRCNLCYRVNELPEEFLYDPVSKTYGDPSRRPECKSSTIEFIAPSEYMLRPPQPAVYLFLLDVSRQALESGYLRNFCDILLDELDKLPGDGRTQLGFITYDRTLQFYMMPEGASQVSQLIVGDVDDIFLPSPSDLLINLQTCKEQIVMMLNELPELFNGTQEVESCLGAALNAAYKMISPTGGRITVLQCTLPNLGPGALTSRESAQQKDKMDSSLLGPTTDFYKKLALECSGQQVAVDMFILANQYVDIATISGISKHSGGQVSAFLGYHSHKNLAVAEKFDKAMRRYLTRKIGFESVMRIRCTRGMSLHTFHGHFFVRSTDLLALPNVNPDAGFGMQVSIDEDLKDSREVSFQAALLYTSSKGERRIRVHTLCLPISNSLQEIVQGADQQCIIGLVAKMGVDRSLNSSIYDAKEAFMNVCIDIISRWRMIQCANQPGALLVSPNLSLVPLYILALLKSFAFTQRSGVPLDERSMQMINLKCLPLTNLMQSIYPDMYRVDQLDVAKSQQDEEGIVIPDPDRLQLSSENIAMSGAYLMDLGDIMYLYLGKVISSFFCEKIFGVSKVTEVDENMLELPELDNEDSERLRSFIHFLNNKKSHSVSIKVMRDDGKLSHMFTSMLIDDQNQNNASYYKFLQTLKSDIK